MSRKRMGLTSGTKLGPYEIISPLGAGGMGEVYRARDTRLERTVAIKILPEGFARDSERLHRFEHEARMLSALNHPNLLVIYDVGAQDGIHYLVSEYLEGLTLRERMSDAALPPRKATEYALSIASGLAAAHEKGIVHRDLKPENVFVTREERVKILDFGLAKQTSPSNTAAETAAMTSANPTAAGMVLGTIGYMSPEQVKGQAADHRSDIFSFGAILYEMATGKRAFRGDSSVETMSAILKEDPPEMAASGFPVAPGLERIVRRCLEKSREQRFQSAKDLGFALESMSSAVSAATPALPARAARWIKVGTVVGALAVLVAALAWRRFTAPATAASTAVRRVTIALPDGEPLALASLAPLGIGRASIAISPDGSRIAYIGNLNGTPALFVRELGRFESRLVPGTQGAFDPFFAPDGIWIGFFSGTRLKIVSLLGGDPVTICEARNPYGATWGPNGLIVFADSEGSSLKQVSSSGGRPTVIVRPAPEEGIFTGPSFLPDGSALLFNTAAGSFTNPDTERIEVVSVSKGNRKLLLEGGTCPHYTASGHLLFLRGGSLFAAPFDLKRLEVTGPAVPMIDQIRTESGGAGQFDVSSEGTLVYVDGSAMWQGDLVWVDRRGVAKTVGLPQQVYGSFRISPDGRRLAVTVAGKTDEVWVYDFGRGSFTRLTPEGYNWGPIWTPNSKRVTYQTVRDQTRSIVSRGADGSGAEERILGGGAWPQSWSPDGKILSFDCGEPWGDVCLLPEGSQKPQAFTATSSTEWGGAFSRDGKWIAYTSDESGRYEVYVRPYPGPGGQWQISTDGGEEPMWSPEGRELFYRKGFKWMTVSVRTSPEFSAEPPRLLFEGPYVNVPGVSYDVAPDGQRFLLLRGPEERKTTELKVVLNWFEELKRPVSTGKQ